MEPQTTWKMLLDAIEANQWRDVRNHGEDLLDWLEKGGFPPAVTGCVNDDYWNRKLAKYACKVAIVMARRLRRRH